MTLTHRLKRNQSDSILSQHDRPDQQHDEGSSKRPHPIQEDADEKLKIAKEHVRAFHDLKRVNQARL